MTIKELIKHLSCLDENTEVFIHTDRDIRLLKLYSPPDSLLHSKD